MPEYGLLTDEQLLAVEDAIWTPARTQQLIENVRYWKARHAVLVEASSPIRRFLFSSITHPLCPFCYGWKKHSATCGYKIWAALVEGEDAEA